MKVEQFVLDRILRLYKPEFRYLKEAAVDVPHAEGLFVFPRTEYVSDEFRQYDNHVTEATLQIGLNQFLYAFLGKGIIEEKLPGLQDRDFAWYAQHRDENNVLYFESHKAFPKAMEPGKEVKGVLDLRKSRISRKGSLYIAEFDFSMAQGDGTGKNATGNFSMAMRL